MLADFNFTHISEPVGLATDGTGPVYFLAPELLHPTKFGLEKGVPSKEGDVYALGMAVYQVLTGQLPFHPKKKFEVIHVVVDGERPPKPENAEEIGMTEALWGLMRECWKEDRASRPVIQEILRKFCEITGEKKTTDSAAKFATPRLDVAGTASLVVSEGPSSTTFAPECKFLVLVVQIVVI